MLLDEITGLAADTRQERRQVAALKLDGGAALATDQVVTVPEPGAGAAVAALLGVDAPHKAQTRQQNPDHGPPWPCNAVAFPAQHTNDLLFNQRGGLELRILGVVDFKHGRIRHCGPSLSATF
jgi:hypothetical protein